MMPMPDLASAVARLEKENRNLVVRLEKLEQRRGSAILAFLANVLLLVMAGLWADLLGLFPAPVERLPVRTREIEAPVFILRDKDGPVRARAALDGKGFRLVDGSGKVVLTYP